ncbi:PIG-L deacetylase family protein [Pararoseomonas indoligenes]|uniref:PIG-L family deacetylase n=1 Tax=Roseomonas indoligenes TaxID=2820811 RepID=A0A940MWR2_9PROT|nr:PIG-L family deacetylase [Pararoseomonas indoligenes]MBP0491180.1 PIG-L family deacetylase [Pararoseomonas indoligenes]
MPFNPGMTDPAPPPAGLLEITGGENALVLALQPGDESLDCGGFIAESCRRGRPPFVMVLQDGSASHPGSNLFPPDRIAAIREGETREAVRRLGLRADRLLMAGLIDGPLPDEGPVFEAAVRGITLVMWARDCNLLLAPWPVDAARAAAHRIAATVAAGSGVAHLSYAPPPEAPADGWTLAIPLDTKRQAIAAHASQLDSLVTDDPAPRIVPARRAAAEQPFETILRPPPASPA